MDVDNSRRSANQAPAGAGCSEHARCLESFGVAVRELLELHEQQWFAILDGDYDSCRFDILIHMANERKQSAKYAYLRHVETHGCSDFNAFNKTRARRHNG